MFSPKPKRYLSFSIPNIRRYAFSFGEEGDDFVGWGGFATAGSMFSGSNSSATGNLVYNGATYAHFIYYFCVLNLVPTIVAGQLVFK